MRFRDETSDFSYTHINTLFRKIYGLWKVQEIRAVINTVSLWLTINYLILQMWLKKKQSAFRCRVTTGSVWRKSGLRVARRATEARTTTSLLNNAYVHKSQRTKWLQLLRKPTSYIGGEQCCQPQTATILNWADRRQEQGCLQACYSNFLNISKYRKEKPC